MMVGEKGKKETDKLDDLRYSILLTILFEYIKAVHTYCIVSSVHDKCHDIEKAS